MINYFIQSVLISDLGHYGADVSSSVEAKSSVRYVVAGGRTYCNIFDPHQIDQDNRIARHKIAPALGTDLFDSGDARKDRYPQ